MIESSGKSLKQRDPALLTGKKKPSLHISAPVAELWSYFSDESSACLPGTEVAVQDPAVQRHSVAEVMGDLIENRLNIKSLHETRT